MKTVHFVLPLFLFADLISGGYVSNNHNNAAGYSYNHDAQQRGGYPNTNTVINTNHHERYRAPASTNTGGYGAPAAPTGGYQPVAAPANDGYGAPCCPNKYPFLPAPPGHTPPCSKHGSTFCERLENYPM